MFTVPLTLCLAIGAAGLASRVDAGPWGRVTAGLVLFQLLASFGAVLAGLFHPFLLFAWAVGALLLARRPTVPNLTLPSGAGFVVGAATLGLWVARTALLPTRLSYDDSTYHAAMPVAWLADGGLHVVPHCYQSYYPLHAELLTYFFALGAGDLTHVGLAPLLHGLTLASAALALAERLELDLDTTAVLIASLLVGRRAYHAAYASTAPDLAVAGLILAAAALGLRTTARSSLGVAGVAAGLAVSTKVPSVIPLGVLGLSLLPQRRRLLWFLAPLVLLGSPFYLRNLVTTGNPLFPAATLGFEGPLDRATQLATSLRPFLTTPGDAWAVVTSRLNWPTPIGLVALGGLLVGLARFRQGHERVVLALMGLIPLVVYPFQPFSGTVNRPDDGLNQIVRYLFPSVALGLVLLAPTASERRGIHRAAPLLWLGVVILSLDVLEVLELVLLGSICVGAWLSRARPLPRWVLPAVVAALALVVLALTPWKRERFRARDRVWISKSSVRQGRASLALDRLPPGSVIAQISDVPVVQDHSVRPWGGRLQHLYRPIDLDGTPLRPLHERWRDEPEGWWWRWDAPVSEDFLDNLVESGVDYLLVTRCNASNRWPDARQRLLEHPNRRVFQSRCGEIWRVSSRGRPEPG